MRNKMDEALIKAAVRRSGQRHTEPIFYTGTSAENSEEPFLKWSRMAGFQ